MTDIEAIVRRWLGWPPEGLVEELEAAFAAARGRWIPVGERLPEKGSCDDGHFDSVSCYTCTKDGNVAIAFYCRPGKCWLAEDTKMEIGNVTHWRELPEPPKEGGSNG